MKGRAERPAGSSGESLFCKALGNRVAFLRRQRNLTQAVLADRSGLSIEYLSRLENGRANPTVLTLRSLAEGLACTVEALMQESAPPLLLQRLVGAK